VTLPVRAAASLPTDERRPEVPPRRPPGRGAYGSVRSRKALPSPARARVMRSAVATAPCLTLVPGLSQFHPVRTPAEG